MTTVFATKASHCCLDFAWTQLQAKQVMGYTSTINTPSRRFPKHPL
jgi:RimJ/RimL family protein N-acetyltransferase